MMEKDVKSSRLADERNLKCVGLGVPAVQRLESMEMNGEDKFSGRGRYGWGWSMLDGLPIRTARKP